MKTREEQQARNLAWIRGGVGLAAGAAILLPYQFQPAIDALWTCMRGFAVFRLSWFETLWTVVIYWALEAFYLSIATDPTEPAKRVDRRPGTKHLHSSGTVRYRRWRSRTRELLSYIWPPLALDLIMIKKYVGVPMQDILASGNYLDYKMGSILRDSLTRLPLKETWSVPSLHRFTWSSPVQSVRALPYGAPTSRQIVLQVAAALAIYDAMFFTYHMALHRIPLLWKYIHALHHHHGEINPQVTNRLDIVERLTIIFSANIALHLVKAHPLTRLVFVACFLYLLVENHAGLDLPYGYEKILPQGIGAGSSIHAEHHRTGKTHYQAFFVYLDNLLLKHERMSCDRSRVISEQ